MTAQRVTFGNDLGVGDRVIDQTTEEITYSIDGSTLQRAVGTGPAQPVAEYVTGLSIEYLKRNGTDPAASEAEVDLVRITFTVSKDGIEQVLKTDVDLRSRG